MLRKTLTILSLIGLLLSVGLWGVSYCGVGIKRLVRYDFGGDEMDYFSTDRIVVVYYGNLYVAQTSPASALLDGEGDSVAEAEVKWHFVHMVGPWKYRVPMKPIGVWHDEATDWLSYWIGPRSQPFPTESRDVEGLSYAGLRRLYFGSVPFTQTIVSVPLWIPTLLFAAPFLACRPFHFLRRRKRKKLGLCVKCGYDLRASKERCPECGEGFPK